MRKVWAVWAVALVLGVAATGLAGGGDKDKEKLQGKWVMTGVKFGGKDVDIPKDKGQVVITFSGDKVTYQEGDKPAEEGTYKLDTSKKPKQIDVTKKESKDGKGKDEMKGIYSLEGDTLKIGFAFQVKKDKEEPPAMRPSSFEGMDVIVMTFTRAKKGDKK